MLQLLQASLRLGLNLEWEDTTQGSAKRKQIMPIGMANTRSRTGECKYMFCY